jgi:hypothetical protein
MIETVFQVERKIKFPVPKNSNILPLQLLLQQPTPYPPLLKGEGYLYPRLPAGSEAGRGDFIYLMLLTLSFA